MSKRGDISITGEHLLLRSANLLLQLRGKACAAVRRMARGRCSERQSAQTESHGKLRSGAHGCSGCWFAAQERRARRPEQRRRAYGGARQSASARSCNAAARHAAQRSAAPAVCRRACGLAPSQSAPGPACTTCRWPRREPARKLRVSRERHMRCSTRGAYPPPPAPRGSRQRACRRAARAAQQAAQPKSRRRAAPHNQRVLPDKRLRGVRVHAPQWPWRARRRQSGPWPWFWTASGV